MRYTLAILQLISALSGSSYAPPRPVVVFWGDSIMARWNVTRAFPQWNTVNAGVGGQTSAEVLARWQSDVAPHSPAVIVIEVGINDLYDSNTANDVTLANVQTMIDLVRSVGATPVLCGLVPVTAGWHMHFDPAALATLHERLRALAAADGVAFADYYAALTPNQTSDGLHPNAAGYAVIVAALAERIAAAF